MSRFLRLSAFILLAACAGSGHAPPSDLNNACTIVRERPSYLKAMKATQKKWGVPVATQMAVIYQESKYDSDARTPLRFVLGVIPMGRQSSAFGYAQALDATWKEYKRAERRPSARRDRFKDASDFMGWYFTNSAEKNGIPLNDTRNQYLAYHEGNTGFARASYRRKPWLMRIADELSERANMYHQQLIACRKL